MSEGKLRLFLDELATKERKDHKEEEGKNLSILRVSPIKASHIKPPLQGLCFGGRFPQGVALGWG